AWPFRAPLSVGLLRLIVARRVADVGAGRQVRPVGCDDDARQARVGQAQRRPLGAGLDQHEVIRAAARQPSTSWTSSRRSTRRRDAMLQNVLSARESAPTSWYE